ncbi:MAG TPA: hypothetical protein ENJ95_01865 [Bacteroidetes bacterium]|nr:hypothetical protein [Bacteroidota bacterium]
MKVFATLVTISTFLLVFNGRQLLAQTSQTSAPRLLMLPKIFEIGEHDQLYEEKMPGYQTLLEACNGDMYLGFDKLYRMMKAMEARAEQVGFDLDGIKAWMHFFWKEDGTIEHIAFHLKPGSKNVDKEVLEDFLKGFAAAYKFPLQSDLKYSHYSSFSFPVF